MWTQVCDTTCKTSARLTWRKSRGLGHTQLRVRRPRSASGVRWWLLACLLSVTRCSGDDDAAGKPAADGGGGDSGLAPFECEADTVQCDGTRAKVCDGKGGFKTTRDCSEKGQTCLSSRLSATGKKL